MKSLCPFIPGLRASLAWLVCALAVCLSADGAIPIIIQQPSRTNVIIGDNAAFQVTASGTAPLSYQWRLAGTNLPGATSATLLLTNVQSSQAGGYQAVASNAEGSTTSVVAQLTVRPLNTSIYLNPPGGWTYRYNGDSMATPGTAALDGTWNHDNGSDAWAADLRGIDNPPAGGLSVSNGILTMEDVVVSGAGNDNRRLYFMHVLSQDPVTNANTILGDGVTFTFRARLTPPTDPLIELTNAPNGFINVADGKGMIGMRQSGSSGMIISFSLNMASEDTNATTLYDFPAAGLHMNNLNGDVRTDKVDPGELGTVNVFPVNPADFHEFWITVQDNGSDPGTHRVSVYVDGSTNPAIFNVTAGIGADIPLTNYLAIGLPSAVQRGAFDLDWVGYKQGVYVPQQADVPVEILTQPASQTVNEGQTATFTVLASGTPPITYQWTRNGTNIPGATSSSYTTAPLLPPDNGAVFRVQCQNATTSITSDPATLTVITDTNPPTLVSAASLNGQSIGLCFSERITTASAQTTANYIVNNGAVTVSSATLRTNANNTTVLLQVSGLSSQAGTVFTVRATNIFDTSFTGNRGGGTVQGVVHGLTATNIGTVNGATFTCVSNRFEMATDGVGLGGTADAFHFASLARTNEFDVRVRLAQLTATNGNGQAGLVARVDATVGSRSVNAFVTPLPGDNAYHATYRSSAGGTTAAWPGGSDKPGVPLPNAWIRLTRAGDVFTAYHGTNGSNWQSYAQLTLSLPTNLLVGIAGANLADSVMDELIFVPPPTIVTPPVNTIATNGDTVTLSVVATSKGDIGYQWRFNGADLPNQTNATLVLANVSPGQAGTYDVRVINGGGTVLSAPATLTVHTLDYGDAPAPYPTLLANNGARHVLVPGIRLGATVDFELNGLPSAGANGDDLNGSADEDGVTFVSPLWVDQTATVQVVASTNGVLNAWIDFGADGSFAQPQDHIFTDYALVSGTNLLSLIVPFDAMGTNTIARFRFSTVGGLAPDGIAPNGEVEDYAVTIIPVADLSVSATDSPDPAAVGSNLTYQVTIRNVGPAIATHVTVTNRFTAGVDFVSAASTRGTCTNNGGLINCAIGDLGLSSNAVITLVVRAQQSGTLTNTFAVFADQPDPNTGDNLVVSTTTVEVAPSITVPPASLTVTQHNTATFSVTAAGTAPLRYQWFFNSTTALTNGTNATLTILDAQSTNQGSYQVRVTNRVGGVLSAVVTLTVLDPPTITQQPQSRTNLAGSTATFTVVAQGTPPLSYQWFFNGTTAVTGATNASLTLTNVQKSQEGTYSVRISNSAGVLDSANAVLTVIEMDFGDAPTPFPTLLADNGARHRVVPGFYLGAGIDFEPDGQANDGADEDGVVFRNGLLIGQTARIEVTASSNGVLNAWIDWNGNGSWGDAGEKIFSDQALTAGTNVLTTTVPLNAQLGLRAARFRFSTATGLSFTNEALNGEVEDYQVTVQAAVDLRLGVTANPVTVRFGSNVVYNIGVTNGGPSAASGVTVTSSLPASVTVISIPASCTNQSGIISCNLGGLGSGVSSNLTITIRPNQVGDVTNVVTASAIEADPNPTNNVVQSVVSVLEFPGITTQPQNVTIISGDSASFQVTATGSALSYQWTFNSGDISGATNATLTINPAGAVNQGTYRVRVSNALGQVTSDPATLTVLVPPAITTQPTNVTVNAGVTATFTVVASGTAPLAYQWIFAGTDLNGQTNATLTIPNTGSTNEGTYRVRVSNAAGTAVSDPATLTVLVGVSITQQPQSKTVFAGSTATLQVVAAGSQPISYQWFLNGTNRLNTQTNATLVLSNVQASQTGPYTVFVSNRVSSLTSVAAQLTVREADFGDAEGPSFSTLLAFNGAYHYIVPGVYLGSRVDFEPDGQPAPNANGDDANGQDDEDGVNFVLPLLVGQQGRVNVIASTNGFLDAWIDFNGNGDWTDLGEQIFTSRALTAGTNSLLFTIPASALPNNAALSRFRFSTVGGLLFSGAAPDGEVEDYVAPISPAVDLAVTLVDQPDPVLVGSNLHVIVTVTNPGPSTANAVMLREILPTSAAFIGATLTQGNYTNLSGMLTWDIGNMVAGTFAKADITLLPQGIGVVAHRAEVTCTEQDVNTNNNVVVQMTTVVTAVGPFVNSNYIAINDFGPASVYPSTITVSGVTGTIHQVIVTLNGLSHVYPDDIDMLLVGPRGQKVVIMSDAGGGNDPAYITFSLDDNSDLVLPDENLIIDEAYRPMDYDPPGDSDVFDPPAPPGPYTNRLAAFKGTDANGVWSLYIMDDFAQDNGELVGGWSLDFLVLDPLADASVNIAAAPSPVGVGQNVTYTLSVSNGGPSAVSSMLLTNVLPTNAVLQSFVSSQGQCTNVAGEIRCDFGVMEGGAGATLTIVMTPQQVGVLSNFARVVGSQLDLNQSNNTASLLTPVRFFADVSLGMSDSQDPVPVNQPFSYTLTVSNRGPQLAQAVVVTNPLPTGFGFTAVTSSQGGCTNQSGVVSCNLGDIAVANFATVQITGQATRIGRMTNSASVQGNSVDGDLTNNQRSEETVVVFAAPLFRNTNGIAVPNPYPSTIQVSGLTGAVYKVAVIVSNLTHSTPESLQLLLVGPSGENVMLMNAVGGNNAISSRTIRLDDQAAVPLPDNTAVTNGTYRPASYSTATSLPAPAPPAPYGSALIAFRGTEANGTWSLFTQGGGTIGAWWLEISTLEPIADLSVSVVSQPSAVSVGSNLTYTVTVSNRGPATATGIVLTNLLPATLGITSATGCTNVCNVASLNAGTQLQFRVDGVALAEGFATNRVSAFAAEQDLNTTNNTATATTQMKNPPSFTSQPQNITVTNGDTARFNVTVGGAGPFTYQWLRNGGVVPGGTAATLVISNAQQADAGLYAVRVSDGVGSPLSAAAQLTVLNRPTITDITNITILEDTLSPDLPFTISDLDSAVLTLEIASSNQGLIPLASVTISGTGNNRSVRVLPATNQVGIATITIAVRDADGISASDSFDVTVLAVNDLPVLGTIGSQVMDEDTQRNISLQASDVEDTPTQLSLSAFVNDTNLLAAAIANRTLTLTALSNQFGATRVTVVLSDSLGGVVSNAFDVTVNPVNDPPTLNSIDPVFIDQKAGLTVVPLSGISGGPSNEPQAVTVRATTANSNLLGNLTVNYTSGANGSVSFETISNFTGTTTISVTVDDGAPTNNTVTRTFGVSIGDTNDPPTISLIADQITAEDTDIQVNFTIGDEETAPNALVLNATSSNTNLVRDAALPITGTNSARTLTISPEPQASGVTFITISVRDELGTSVTRSFRLDVSPVNDPPTLQVIPVLDLAPNAPTQIVPLTGISAGAPDEPHNLLITATSSNPLLIPDPIVSYSNPNTSGTLTIQPGIIGTAMITIVVDDRGASNNILTRTLTIDVKELNNAPVISRIFNQATPEDTPIDVPFTVFDAESPADSLVITALSSNTNLIPNQTLSITSGGTNRSLRAVPASDTSGISTITITASDTNGASSTITFALEVTPVNDLPVIGDIQNQQITEDSVFGPLAFYVNDLETNPNALILSAVSSNPTLVPQSLITLLGSETNRSIRISPVQNRSGSATITVTVRDGDGGTASDSFVLTVQPTNDAPVISTISDQTINMDTSVAIPFTINDQETDPDALSLTVSSSNPSVLPLTNIVLSGSSVNRSALLTPLANATGTSIVSIVVTDTQGLSNSTTFALQVAAGTGLPLITLQPESLTVTNGATATFSVTASGAPTLRFRWRLNGTNLPSGTNATLVITNARSADAGPYSVSVGNNLGSVTSTVAILTVVTSGSTTPQINTIADLTTPEDTPVSVNLTLQDSDTPPHFLMLSATSTNATLIPPANYFFEGTDFNRTLTILPGTNQFGTNFITVTVSDGVLSSSKSFVLRVTSVNDAPTLDRIAGVSALANTQVTVPLTGISPGGTNEPTQVSITAIHNNPAVLTNLTVNYTPGASTGSLSVSVLSNATGSATITVTATDGGPATLRTFQVVVRPATNQVPIVSGLTNIVIAEDTPSGPISFFVNDPDGPPAQVTITAVSANTNVIPATGISVVGTGTNRTITVTPATNQFGSSTITLTASDSLFGLSTTNFTVTVQSVNDLPVISAIASQVLFEDNRSAPIPISIRDVETPAGALTLTASSSNQGLIPNTNILFGGSGSNRVMVLQAVNGQAGSATITVTLSDLNGGSTVTNCSVTVVLTNDTPIISDLTNITINADTATGEIPFTVWDEETVANSLSVSAVAADTVLVPPGNITLSGITSNRTINIQPAAGRTGASTITVSVSDGNSSASKSFVLRVIKADTNAAPTLDALPDVFVNEDSLPLTINLTGISPGAGENGQIVALGARSAKRDLIPDPTVSYVNPSSSGTLTLAPAPGTNGVTTITVTANDGKTNFSRVFNVTVRARPALSPIADIVTDEDVTSAAISFGVSDVETPASNLVFAVTSSNPTLLPPTNVTIVGLGTNRTLTVLGAPNEFGFSLVTLAVTDSDGLSRSNVFGVTINAVNDPPTLGAISSITMTEDQGPLTTNITGITSGAANEFQLLMLDVTSSAPSIVPAPAVSYTSPQNSAALTFTPLPNAYGSANITVTVNDGQSANQFTSRVFQVRVTPVDDLPTLNPISDLVRDYDAAQETILLSGISAGGANENQTVTVQASSSNPVLISNLIVSYTSPNSAGSLTLSHNSGVSGNATITVTVSDGPNNVAQTFLVTVNPAPSRFAVYPIPGQTIAEDSTSGPINFTINDDGQPAVEFSAISSNPTLIGPAGISFGGAGTNRTITLAPGTNQFGNAIITVVMRASGMSASNSFQLTVTGVDDFPFFVQAVTNIVMDEDTELEVPFMVDDLETPAATLVVAATPYNRLLFPPGRVDWFQQGPRERSILFKPAPNQFGTSVIELRVRDQSFQRATNLFTVTVRPVNDLPSMSTVSDQTIREDTDLVIGFVVDDVETPAGSLVISASCADTNLFASESFQYVNNGIFRTIQARPVQNRFGTNLITVVLRDADGGVVSNSFTVRVLPVNDPPSISTIAAVSTSVGQPTGQLPFTIGDIETNPNQLTLRALSSNTNLTPVGGIQFSGTGSNRFVGVTPAPAQTGLAVITVQVADLEGATAETSFELVVNGTNGPPVIVLQPRGQDVFVGDDFSLRVLATGPGLLSYQWQRDGSDLPGATNPVFSTTAAVAISGDYRATVSNANGITFSQTAAVHVYQQSRISRITRVGNAVQLFFDTVVGQTYTVEYRDALASGTWQDLQTVSGTGAEVTVTDGAAAGPTRFYRLRINLSTAAPSLSQIDPQTINEDESVSISFTLSDTWPMTQLRVMASSGNQALVPDGNMTITDSGGGICMLTIRPATNQFGADTISISVTDPGGAATTMSFPLTVTSVNDLPVISGLSNQTIPEDGQKFMAITLEDVETSSDALLVNITSSDTNLFTQSGLTITGSGTNRTLMLAPAADQFGVATVNITVTDQQGGTTFASFQVTVDSVHDPPTLGVIGDVIIGEDAALQRIALTDIGTGAANEIQDLNLAASLSNSNLLTNLVLQYTSPQTTGTLSFATVPNAFGTATVTVVVNDGGPSNNIISRSFVVTVSPVNDLPTLDAITNLTLTRDAPPQTISLTGISSGAANESQTLSVIASNSNPALLTNVAVVYTSPQTNGLLNFQVIGNATGTAIISVSVNDNGLSNNVISRAFSVTVNPPPTIYLEAESGVISSPMIVATASNAFNGRYIYSPVNNQGTASYQVNIPSAGTYAVWCRVIGSNDLSDSFFVSMDGGTEGIYDTSLAGWLPDWVWNQVNSRGGSNPQLFTLSQGTHTLLFRGRDAETRLDALYITADQTFVPPGNPGPNAIDEITSIDPSTATLLPSRINRIRRVGTATELSFSTVSTQLYAVEYNDSLEPSSWRTLKTVIGTGKTVTLSDTGATTPNRFYRVRSYF